MSIPMSVNMSIHISIHMGQRHHDNVAIWIASTSRVDTCLLEIGNSPVELICLGAQATPEVSNEP